MLYTNINNINIYLGLFFRSIKANPEKYLRKICGKTLEWLKKLKETKITFLMTSSNADYAKLGVKQL